MTTGIDTPPEERFDRLTTLSAQFFKVPISFVSLIDKKRQWFKSCFGIQLKETPRDINFCKYTIKEDGILVIPDLSIDQRFANHPFVTGDPFLRFYAGIPLLSEEGYKIGTLCILDTVPRNFEAQDKETLKILAKLTEEELGKIELIRAKKELILTHKEVLAKQQTLKTITDNIPLLIAYLDKSLYFRFNNLAYYTWFGKMPEELFGTSIQKLIDEKRYNEVLPKLQAALSGKKISYESQVLLPGGRITIHSDYIPHFDEDNKVVGLYVVAYDITIRKQLEFNLHYQAMHDVLTDLPNRAALREFLHKTICKNNFNHQPIAIMFLDLDHFKSINDLYGHEAGDEVLKEFSLRLSTCVEKSGYVSRLAGDEFVIVLENLKQPLLNVEEIAKKIIKKMTLPFCLPSVKLSVSTSIGIILNFCNKLTIDQLIKKADEAMYQAKKAGKNKYIIRIEKQD
ncbi:MAG: diguanylate cyclase [Francisellaceae bacterium]|nr:diguanylate cyclase [Francisellaceae bacterium]